MNGNEVHLTVSIGIAGFPQHAKSAAEVLEMADEAMYKGKDPRETWFLKRVEERTAEKLYRRPLAG